MLSRDKGLSTKLVQVQNINTNHFQLTFFIISADNFRKQNDRFIIGKQYELTILMPYEMELAVWKEHNGNIQPWKKNFLSRELTLLWKIFQEFLWLYYSQFNGDFN